VKVWIVWEEGEEGDSVLAVFASLEAAVAAYPRRWTTEHDVLSDPSAAPVPKGHAFDRGIFGRTSEEYLCRICGDVQSTH
jgi:hypothetical protein